MIEINKMLKHIRRGKSRFVGPMLDQMIFGHKKREQISSLLSSSGDRTRTCDLWVMSPTSYQLLHPAILDCKDTPKNYFSNHSRKIILRR